MLFKKAINRSVLELTTGNITNQDTEAIVNPANKRLLAGGGASGAIHREAGKHLQQKCLKLNGCLTGEAKITKAFNLKNKYIIHTVGPVYSGKKDAFFLKEAYLNSLRLADSFKIKSIAFPSISTGAFGYPIKKASKTALETIIKFILEENKNIELLRMVLFKDTDFYIYLNNLKKLNF